MELGRRSSPGLSPSRGPPLPGSAPALGSAEPGEASPPGFEVSAVALGFKLALGAAVGLGLTVGAPGLAVPLGVEVELGFELALGLPPSLGSPLRVGLALPVAVGTAVPLGLEEGDAEGAPGSADEGEAVGCADPPQATVTVSPCSAPTTSAKSVLTVTGSLICFPGFAAHLPSTFTLATARPAPSAVIVAFSLFASGSASELSTGDVAEACPTFTLTFFVTDGPSEKDSPRRETSIV